MQRNNRGVWIALGVLALILFAGPMLGGGFWGPGMMGGRYGGQPVGLDGWMWGLGMGLRGVGMLVFWGVVIALVVLFARRASGGSPPAAYPDDAEEILRRRFAAGEITREQYEDMRRVLGG